MVKKDFAYYDEHRIIEDVRDISSRKKYATGYKKIDDVAMPRAGHCTLIPAYTHHGKSVFAMNLCYNMFCLNPGTSFVFYTFEATAFEVIVFLSHILAQEKKQTTAHAVEWNRRIVDEKDELHAVFMSCAAELSQRIFLYDKRIGVSELDHHMRNVIDDKKNVGVVFIDYLQDMRPENRSGSHHGDIEAMAIDVDRIASEYGVAVIMPAQYRQPENYTAVKHKRNLIGEGRIFGSSSLAKKADVIYSLYNDSMFQYQFCGEENVPRFQELEVDVLKARGQNYAKNLTLKFDRATCRIVNSDRVVIGDFKNA